MKNFCAIRSIALAGILAAWASPVVVQDAQGQSSRTLVEVVPLMAGQTMVAGQVTVELDDNADYVYVTYQTTSAWTISEIHLALSASLEGVPQTSTGNPKNGKFPYQAKLGNGITSYTVEVPISSLSSSLLVIAAHAVVNPAAGNSSGTQTAWGDGLSFSGKNWATYFWVQLPLK
jgi:hypothetical protein